MIEKGSHTTESDQSLLDALIKGEETAFEKIYKSYFALLQNYSASIVGDSEAALEIIQNIFVALWENSRPGKISAQLPASQHAQQFPALPQNPVSPPTTSRKP